MAFQDVKLRPGVNTEATLTLNEAGISSCSLIRFKAGLPQKLGGWTRFYPFMVGTGCRALHAWQDQESNKYLAAGLQGSLGVISNGVFTEIIPFHLTTDAAPDFSTTNGSPTVTVVDSNNPNVNTSDVVEFRTPISVGGLILSGVYPIAASLAIDSYQITAASNATGTVSSGGAVPVFDTTNGSASVQVTLDDHGLSVGGTINFALATVVGGVTIFGTYSASAVADTDHFTIIANAQATSTDTVSMNGGNAEFNYNVVVPPPAPPTGYSDGTYSEGYYSGITVSDNYVPIVAEDWSLDNWGSFLIACAKNGALYYWQPNSGYQTAIFIPQAPPYNGGAFVAMPARILVAWGSTDYQDIGLEQNPLLVRWSDANDFFNWTVSDATQAGSFPLSRGSKIVGGIQAPQQALIFTDVGVWSMNYIQPPDVFGFNEIGIGCGLIGQHAVTQMNGAVYWMSTGNFYVLGGAGVRTLPCSVWDVVFQDLDTENAFKCVAAANAGFNEISFFYPSLSGRSGEIDKYVKVNVDEGGVWDYGSLARSAWIDQSVLGNPIGASPDGLIFQHETSLNADGAPLVWSFETGYFVIGDGENMAFIDWFFPDMKWGLAGGSQNATVNITITGVDYPNGAETVYGPFVVTSASTSVVCRIRNRQIKMLVGGNDMDSFARLGLIRFRIAPAGRR